MTEYRSNIFIDGAAESKVDGRIFTPDRSQAASYESSVAQVLDFILQKTITGHALVREILRSPMGKSLRIIPFPLQDARTIASGAAAAANSTSATILYHPLTWMLDPFRTGHVGNLMPDDVLVHELMHGLRMMSGLMLTGAMEDDAQTGRYENREEFYALLVANIYVSELNKTMGRNQKLRGNISAPHRFVALSPDEANSSAFYSSHAALIDRLDKEMMGLCNGGGLKGLADAPGDFNPIREAEKVLLNRQTILAASS